MPRTRHALPTSRPRMRPGTRIVAGTAGVVAAVVGLVLVAAACGSTMQTVPAREAPPVGGDVPAVSAAAGGLATANTPIGTVVTSDGFTLYRFAGDRAEPPTSTCVDACARTWPPVLGDGVPAVTGVPSGAIGTVGRPDGTQQLTLNGWPLYRFAEDATPGEAKGEGVGGEWHAIGLTGAPVAATPR